MSRRVWKPDRWARSALDPLQRLQQLDRAGVTVEGPDPGDRSTSAVGQLVSTILGAMAAGARAHPRGWQGGQGSGSGAGQVAWAATEGAAGQNFIRSG